MFYNIGLFLRFVVMSLVGAQGAWLSLERHTLHRRWVANGTNWTSHEPLDKVNLQANEYWFTRWELLSKKHMKPNFRTFREEEPRG